MTISTVILFRTHTAMKAKWWLVRPLSDIRQVLSGQCRKQPISQSKAVEKSGKS
ncbi:hypothetical protein D3C72_800690 [compost metagenome]